MVKKLILQGNLNSSHISVYIHWPFCLSKCPYCDFNSHILQDINIVDWVTAYKKSIDIFRNVISNKYIKTIYFGGGTPSLMPIQVIEAVMNKLTQYAKVDSKTEITLEVNPTSSEKSKFKQIRDSGINRLSVGVQSFSNTNLKFLGRNHTAKESIEVISNAKSIFPNISLDLIYALPNQTITEWEKELHEAVLHASQHISLYQLTIEKGTEFYSQFRKGNLVMPNDSIASDMYNITNEYLDKHNFFRYEISNYAKSGYHSNHNLNYWHYNNYIGIGAGAHSRLTMDNNKTYAVAMLYKPSKWLEDILNNRYAIHKKEILKKNDVITETIMMGLRLVDGINIDKLKSLFNISLKDIFDMEKFRLATELGYITYDKNNIYLTDNGLKIHNYLVPRLLNI